MHPLLEQSAQDLEQHFRADPRCLGIYLWGSAGRGTDDRYSDLDLGVVIRDEAFDTIRAELRSICERICGKIQGWLPEGERDQFGNYAFLFEAGTHLLLCDLTVMSADFLARNPSSRPIRILFDPEGRLAAAQKAASPSSYSPDRLLPTLHEYWVYAYLNGKYWQRSDLDKLLYVQSRLFQIHVRLLHALHPNEEWSWWPMSLHHLPHEHQAAMRVYFSASDLAGVAAALPGELSLFSRDARTAARAWDATYPDALEDAVRCHLRVVGLPIS